MAATSIARGREIPQGLVGAVFALVYNATAAFYRQ